MQSPIDPLESLLARWQREKPPSHQPLSAEVWRRIADAETPTARISIWAQIEVVFSRPSFAAAFVVACVLGGLFVAEARLSSLQADRNARLEQSYVELVDPLLNYTARPQTTSVSR
jgi:hypothetical protein